MLKKELDLPIIEMSDTSAKLDGGDVLFTGKEFFVGLSDWTNEAGARAVAVSFPEYPCTPIKVSENQIRKKNRSNVHFLGVRTKAPEIFGDRGRTGSVVHRQESGGPGGFETNGEGSDF